MNKQRGNSVPLKGSKTIGRTASYSVETPYGFHLDLDFLKYVDDIEKGTTIKRVPMHKREGGQNNGAFSRNLSLPGYGSRVKELNYINSVWLKSKQGDFNQPSITMSSRKGESFLKTFTCAEMDSLQAFDEQPLGQYIRPNLLRASSLPSTVLLRKQSESMEDPNSQNEILLHYSTEDVFHETDSWKGKANRTLQNLSAALERVGKLEEEIRVVPELKAQICILQEERERLLVQLDSHNKSTGALDVYDVPLHWEMSSVDKEDRENVSDDWMNREYEWLEKNLKASSEQIDRVSKVSTTGRIVPENKENKNVSPDKNSLDDKDKITEHLQRKGVLLEHKFHELQTELEKTKALLKHQVDEGFLKDEKIKQLTLKVKMRCTLARATLSEVPLLKTIQFEGPDKEGTTAAEMLTHKEVDIQPLNQSSGSKSEVQQHVQRLQELLHEQWESLCKNESSGKMSSEHLPPRVSVIQEQLKALVSLLSLAVLSPDDVSKQALPAVDENPTRDYPSSEGNIDNVNMDTEDGSHILNIKGDTDATKNTSENCEEWTTWTMNSSEQKSRDVEFNPEDDIEPSKLKEKNEDMESVKKEFMEACCFLQDHMNRVAEPDDEMSQALSVVFHEWFHVSAEERACADIVHLYLTEVNMHTPTVLQFLVNMVDDNGNSALHYSVSHCNFSIVKLLLDTGECDVNLRNKSGLTPFMLASVIPLELSTDMKVVQQLMELSDVKARSGQVGQTALHLAAKHGCVPVLRLLLERGEDPNLQDQAGTTPLMCACEQGHLSIVRILLEKAKCDVTLKDKGGRSALFLASKASHAEIVDLLKARTESKNADKCKVS